MEKIVRNFRGFNPVDNATLLPDSTAAYAVNVDFSRGTIRLPSPPVDMTPSDLDFGTNNGGETNIENGQAHDIAPIFVRENYATGSELTRTTARAPLSIVKDGFEISWFSNGTPERCSFVWEDARLREWARFDPPSQSLLTAVLNGGGSGPGMPKGTLQYAVTFVRRFYNKAATDFFEQESAPIFAETAASGGGESVTVAMSGMDNFSPCDRMKVYRLYNGEYRFVGERRMMYASAGLNAGTAGQTATLIVSSGTFYDNALTYFKTGGIISHRNPNTLLVEYARLKSNYYCQHCTVPGQAMTFGINPSASQHILPVIYTGLVFNSTDYEIVTDVSNFTSPGLEDDVLDADLGEVLPTLFQDQTTGEVVSFEYGFTTTRPDNGPTLANSNRPEFIIQAYYGGMLWAAWRDRVYWGYPGELHAFPSQFYYDLDSTILRVFTVAGRLCVLTKDTLWVNASSDPFTVFFSPYPLPYPLPATLYPAYAGVAVAAGVAYIYSPLGLMRFTGGEFLPSIKIANISGETALVKNLTAAKIAATEDIVVIAAKEYSAVDGRALANFNNLEFVIVNLKTGDIDVATYGNYTTTRTWAAAWPVLRVFPFAGRICAAGIDDYTGVTVYPEAFVWGTGGVTTGDNLEWLSPAYQIADLPSAPKKGLTAIRFFGTQSGAGTWTIEVYYDLKATTLSADESHTFSLNGTEEDAEVKLSNAYRYSFLQFRLTYNPANNQSSNPTELVAFAMRW